VDKIPRLADAPMWSLPSPQHNDRQNPAVAAHFSRKLRSGYLGRRLAVQSYDENCRWKETTDSSCSTSDDETLSHEKIDAKQVAEDFAKKVQLLSLS